LLPPPSVAGVNLRVVVSAEVPPPPLAPAGSVEEAWIAEGPVKLPYHRKMQGRRPACSSRLSAPSNGRRRARPGARVQVGRLRLANAGPRRLDGARCVASAFASPTRQEHR